MKFESLLVLASLAAFPAFAAVNIDAATQSELEAVRGLGSEKAQAIIQYRQANGNFKQLEELDNVKGSGKVSKCPPFCIPTNPSSGSTRDEKDGV